MLYWALGEKRTYIILIFYELLFSLSELKPRDLTQVSAKYFIINVTPQVVSDLYIFMYRG